MRSVRSSVSHHEEETGSPTERFLFGGRLRYDLGFNRHEGALLNLSPWQAARRLPALVAEALRLAFEADPRAMRWVATAELLQGAGAAAMLLSAKELISSFLSTHVTASMLRDLLPYIITAVLAAGLRALASAVSRACMGRLEPKVERVATERYLQRVINVELASIEDPEFHRLLDSAQHGATAARRMLLHCGTIANVLITFVATAAVLTTLNVFLLPLLVLVALPRSWSALKNARARYTSTHAWIEHARAAKLLSALLIERHSAPEIRVHGAGRFLLGRYGELARASEREQARLARDAARTQLLAAALTGLATFFSYGALIGLTVSGAVGLAVVSTAAVAMRTATANLTALLAQANSLYEDALFVADLRALCEQAELRAVRVGGKPLPENVEFISFEDVSFTYPSSSRPALRKVNLAIPKGSVVALVGENGSGKTTLVKLLAGLYTADSGKVMWADVNACDADRQDLQSRIAMVAQDFKRWPFTARANVAISRPDMSLDEERLDDAASYAGADDVIAELPRGWDTLLAREYRDGHGVSGGQWQRLGIARARYRDAPLLIVDEPTSALDPRAESEIFEKILRQKEADQTVVLVTHRLASVRTADVVYVLKDGYVFESGSPDELLAADGIFAELFKIQAKAYEGISDEVIRSSQ
ncbi:ABC transporter ATP-binding protein [Streptomyces sp. NPDC058476]|uniref:ABC transporter ATP-binding protein n=1 Tax=Streptomyces sp. NPDC058476 TaxID=3346519 RepID=UPI00366707FA